jgi:hypothetical protein
VFADGVSEQIFCLALAVGVYTLHNVLYSRSFATYFLNRGMDFLQTVIDTVRRVKRYTQILHPTAAYIAKVAKGQWLIESNTHLPQSLQASESHYCYRFDQDGVRQSPRLQ